MLDRFTAGGAGQGPAVVDAEISLKVTRLALAADEITQGRAPLADGFAQDLADRRYQSFVFGRRDLAGWSRRMNAGGK